MPHPTMTVTSNAVSVRAVSAVTFVFFHEDRPIYAPISAVIVQDGAGGLRQTFVDSNMAVPQPARVW